jgi:DNA-binding MarR family transcriptional regulator
MRRPKDNELVRNPRLPSSSKDLETYLPYLLNRLTSRWNIDQNRDLSEFGINGTILRALSVLHIHKTLTVNEIAYYALVEQSNASRTIDSMVAAGLVERQIGEADLRRREVALTEKGERLLKQLWPIMTRNHEKLVSDIPEKDLKACAATLLAMIRNAGESKI